MTRRLFTPEQANRTLPLVRRIVADILARGKELRKAAEIPDRQESEDLIAGIQGEIQDLMGELEQIGCYYKDWSFDVGLVDFPGEIDGELVFLCWRTDEPQVTWYHPIRGGYAKRAPIPPHLLAPAVDSGVTPG